MYKAQEHCLVKQCCSTSRPCERLGERIMTTVVEQRSEKRLHMNRPIWFSEGHGKTLYCGRTLAISSMGISLSCYLTRKSLPSSRQITVYFEVPHLNIVNLALVGRILRIDTIDGNFRRIVILFDEPLPFKPSELELLNPSFAAAV